MQFLKADTSVVIMLGPAVDKGDGVTLESGLVTAMDTATTGVRISKNGGAWADRNGTPTTTVYDEGWYRVTLDTTDTNTEGTLDVMFEEAATCLPLMARFQVVNANVYDSLFAAATTDYLQVDTFQLGGTTQSATDLKDFADAGYDPGTNKVQGVVLTDTTTAVTNGVTLANGAVTNASLAGNMEIVFETDFATNYNQTDNAWVTNGTTFIGTGWNTGKTGYSLTATTGLGNQTADITGNLSGSVGSISGVTFPTNFADLSITASTGRVDVSALAGQTAPVTNMELLFDGNEAFYSAHSGPRGPGVYLNDAAANTNTTNGVDGTIGNPVSTIAAATTIADSLGIDRIYLVNDSSVTAAQTYADYEFVGIGNPSANVFNVGDQIFTNCAFFNLTLEGDCSASSGRFYAEGCILQDESGAGTSTFYIYAYRCGLFDSFRVTNNDDHFFDQCFSMVAGNGTPTIDLNSGAAVDVCFRHYSGGIQIDNGSATATMSVETDGQVVVDATCNSAFVLTVRGCASITDNATLSSLTVDAVYNAGNVNAEVVNVIKTDTMTQSTLCPQEAPPVNATLEEAIAYLYKAWRNRSTQTATTYSLYADDATTVDQKATVSDDTTTADKGEVGTGP